MSRFDFDTPVNRRGTGSIKYAMASHELSEDVIPLWVADMDFPTAPGVQAALQEMARFNIYGYTGAGEGYFPALAGWYEKHFSLSVKEEWLVRTPGVVFALAMGVRAFTLPGEAVMVSSPVYYPFFRVVLENGRRLVDSPLREKDGAYFMDFADIEEKIRKEKVKLFILCSPHNPVGRVWSREELETLAGICERHGVRILSDEIHSDFVWEGVHTPLPLVSGWVRDNCALMTAPSKTFNLAGLCCSNIFIPNPKMKELFEKEISACGAGLIPLPGLLAAQAAYESGEEWLCEVKAYIRANMVFMQEFLQRELPSLSMALPQGTYLTWVDFRGLGLSEEEREDLLLHRAKIWLDSGAMFGKAGEGFERFNLATNRCVLEKALWQLKGALS